MAIFFKRETVSLGKQKGSWGTQNKDKHKFFYENIYKIKNL